MNQGMRHGLYIFFVPVIIITVLCFLSWKAIAGIFICAVAMLIIKLTDIEEAILKR
jgi:hypothetical protein